MTPLRPRLALALVLALGLVQLAVPAWMIVQREQTLAHGTAWRFRTAPVDPADALRGHYLALRFDQGEVQVPEDHDFVRGERVHAALGEGDDGFARLGSLSRERPDDTPYLTARVDYVGRFGPDDETPSIHLELPFDRLYMDEELAPHADRRFWQNRRRARGVDGDDAPEPPPAWAVVRVLDGRAVLEDVLIDGRPIRELALEPPEATVPPSAAETARERAEWRRRVLGEAEEGSDGAEASEEGDGPEGAEMDGEGAETQGSSSSGS